MIVSPNQIPKSFITQYYHHCPIHGREKCESTFTSYITRFHHCNYRFWREEFNDLEKEEPKNVKQENNKID